MIELNQTEVELIAALADHSSPENADTPFEDPDFVMSEEVQTEYERGMAEGQKRIRYLCDEALRRALADELEIDALKARIEDLKGRSGIRAQQTASPENAALKAARERAVVGCDEELIGLIDAALLISAQRVTGEEPRTITDMDREYASELLADLENPDLPRLEIAARWFRKSRIENSLGCPRAQCAPWQPIATAPKDGTRILVCRDDRFPRNTYVVRWLKDVWNIGPIGGEWHAYPTHWMPLPAGPSSTSPECRDLTADELSDLHADAVKTSQTMKATIQPQRMPVDPTRCEVCDWPFAESRERGCVPGDCCYRPDTPAEQERIRQRRAALALTRPECGDVK